MLHGSFGPDGKKYTYAQILEGCGLPVTREWERSLSNWLTAQGLRRRVEYKHKRNVEDVGVLLPDDGIEPIDYEKVLQGLYEIDRIVEDFKAAMKNALLDLSVALHDQYPDADE